MSYRAIGSVLAMTMAYSYISFIIWLLKWRASVDFTFKSQLFCSMINCNVLRAFLKSHVTPKKRTFLFEGYLTVHLPHEIKWNANLMQLCNFIDVFLARHVSGIHTHHQENYMLSCSIWFSVPSFWMDGALDSRCVVCVYGADGAVRRHHPHRTHDLRSGSQDHHPSKLSSWIKLVFHFISFTFLLFMRNVLYITPTCFHLITSPVQWPVTDNSLKRKK